MTGPSRPSRRAVLRSAALVATVPVAALVPGRPALAQERLSESDPAARALGYVHDAANVDADRYPRYEPGQQCSNCNLLQGSEGESWRPCDIFPDRLVAANGWCSAWVPSD